MSGKPAGACFFQPRTCVGCTPKMRGKSAPYLAGVPAQRVAFLVATRLGVLGGKTGDTLGDKE